MPLRPPRFAVRFLLATESDVTKEWLERFLPRLPEEDAGRYRDHLIKEGFDSSEGLEHVSEDDLEFMRTTSVCRLLLACD